MHFVTRLQFFMSISFLKTTAMKFRKEKLVPHFKTSPVLIRSGIQHHEVVCCLGMLQEKSY